MDLTSELKEIIKVFINSKILKKLHYWNWPDSEYYDPTQNPSFAPGPVYIDGKLYK